MNFNPHSYPGANPGGFRSESNEGDDESRAKSDRLRGDFQSADAANAAALRALLGLPAAEAQTAREGRAGVNIADIGNVQIEGAAIMIGGGGEMIAALFAAGLVDEIHAYIAPLIFGGATAPTPADGAGLMEGVRLNMLSVEKLEDGGVLAKYQVLP